MTWQPLYDRVFIEPEVSPELTESGIVIPEVAKQRPQIGVVTHAGPDVSEVDIGDRVLYGQYVGHWVELDGISRLIVRQGDIIAWEDKEDAVPEEGE